MSRIQVLDGGMGTTLESLGADVSTPLWGCDLLQTDPGVIASVHKQFIDSGADLVQTATYQLTLPTLCRHAKLDEKTGGEVMRSAIPLADLSGGVVLSIGPFGATLSPSQEYAGIYQPPYGSGSNYIAPEAEEAAVESLEEFHLARLLTFSDDPTTWDKVSWIAFETTPLLTEYRAVRRAMTRLHELGRGKKFWISSAWPNGLHPQLKADGGHVSVKEVLEAALGAGGIPANGIGLNCTNPTYISALAREFTQQMKGYGPVTFVLYPDGGSVYDTVTRTWSSGGLDPESWGRQVSAVAHEVEAAEVDGKKVWDGVIVGGCCKAGFREIKALAVALR